MGIYYTVIAMVVAHNNYSYSFNGAFISVTEDEISKLPTLELLFGDYWLQVLPKHYLFNYAKENLNLWTLCIDTYPFSNELVLGNSFLKGYYTVHDYETNRFGFAPHSASSKRAPEKDSGAEPEPMHDITYTLDLLGARGYSEIILAFERIVRYFNEGKPLPEPAADSAYYLISAIVISPLMSFALF